MKNHQRSHFSLCLWATLAGCSDGTQFTEKGIAANVAASENATASENAGAESIDSSKPAAEGTAYAEPISEDAVVSSSGSPMPKQEPGSTTPAADPVFRQATSSGSGLKTNTTTVSASPLSQAEHDAILAQCASGVKKSIKRQIRFPEQTNCQWSKDGNLARRDSYLQAAEAQSSSLILPSNAQLCGLSIGSQAGTLHYDDFIILTLNGYVLLSSNQDLLQPLTGTATTAYQWDFSKVRGRAVDFKSPAYCMGAMASTCQVPVTDIPGQFNFEINPESLMHLSDRIFEQDTLNFSLIGTGDNDDKDCFHTDMTLDFTLQYVEK